MTIVKHGDKKQMIVSSDINQLISLPEGQYFDRKSARIHLKDLARHICAFANASGGTIAVGIEDDGKVSGFKFDGSQDIEELQRCYIFQCEPAPIVSTRHIPVVNDNGEDDEVLLLDVAASNDCVIHRKDDKNVYLRVGDKSVALAHSQIMRLEYDKNQRIFEDEVVQWSNIEDIDHEVLDDYKQKIHGSDLSDEQVLRSRKFLIGDHLTNAGVLLFAKDPTQFLPQARVRVLRFEGNHMRTGRQINILKDQSFDSPIPKTIKNASALISSMLREFQYLGEDGRFGTIPEYPEFAWFEGLVNAVIHRDYAFQGDYIRISMYDDRLEVLSPGPLPNIVTLDNMRTTRYARNPRIARALVEFGWARELNEGVQRIYTEMQSAFLNDPVYSEPEHAKVQLTLENSITSRVLRNNDSLERQISPEVLHALSVYEMAAVQLAYAEGQVTVKKLTERINRSSRTVRKVLKGLRDKNVLQWHGSSPKDPSQYYSLNDRLGKSTVSE